MTSTTAWQEPLVATLRATPGIALSGGRKPRWSQLGGNALAAAWSLSLAPARFFVKVAARRHAAMLAAEAEALRAIAATEAIRVPEVIASGELEEAAFLALEWLDIVDGGRGADLGDAVARLHHTTGPQFGWHRDNTIGATPQSNAWSADWAAFFRDRRLAPQLALASRNGFGGSLERRGQRLLLAVPALLAGHEPKPSLLHGDLWSGNAGRLEDGTPVVFDPASYFGDRETDLAMSELFGGFGSMFYAAYAEVAPLPAGYPMRRTLYNLYHVLNHLNLFGEGYLARAETMIGELLAQVR